MKPELSSFSSNSEYYQSICTITKNRRVKEKITESSLMTNWGAQSQCGWNYQEHSKWNLEPQLMQPHSPVKVLLKPNNTKETNEHKP